MNMYRIRSTFQGYRTFVWPLLSRTMLFLTLKKISLLIQNENSLASRFKRWRENATKISKTTSFLCSKPFNILSHGVKVLTLAFTHFVLLSCLLCSSNKKVRFLIKSRKLLHFLFLKQEGTLFRQGLHIICSSIRKVLLWDIHTLTVSFRSA